MTLDDESLLSGYLDDELDAQERQAVEAALQTDPALADRLRELSACRELVGRLGRPRCPIDLTSVVVAQANARPVRSLRFLGRSDRVLPALISVGAIAASLVAIFFRGPNQGAAPNLGPVAVRPRAHLDPVPPEPRAVAEAVTPAAPSAVLAAPATTEVSSGPLMAGTMSPAEQDRLRKLLDRPDARRILIKTDSIDVAGELGQIIARTARKSADFGRIVIQQGIVIDPANPSEATVFALVMDGREKKNFLQAIGGLQDHVEEHMVGPELLAQLTDLPETVLLAGNSAAGLGAPPSEVPPLALKSAPHPNDHGASLKPTRSESHPDKVVVQRPELGALGDPGPPETRSLDSPPPPVESANDGPRLFLVWVTNKDRPTARP